MILPCVRDSTFYWKAFAVASQWGVLGTMVVCDGIISYNAVVTHGRERLEVPVSFEVEQITFVRVPPL